ncbi:MAG: metalloregulator ArsR/SmtB family transcription factor [Minisyncoccia bacterium]|jgi:DNA-binding transcriptional ArsR family regulator
MKEKEAEKILKALANRRRISILRYLKQVCEKPVGNIAYELHLSLTATSRHLNILERADILEKEQRGLEVFYHISESAKSFVRHLISEL